MNDHGKNYSGGSRLVGKALVKAQHKARVQWIASLRKTASKRR